MNIKKYLKENTLNCLLNGEIIDFEYVYSLYLKFKKIGYEIIKEHKINKIIIKDDNIGIPKYFVNIHTDLDYILKYQDNLDIKLNLYEHINLAILSSGLNSAFKRKLHEGEISKDFEQKINNIIEIYIINEKISKYELLVKKLPAIIQDFGEKNNYKNEINEILLYNKNVLKNHLDFLNIFSLFFHFLKIEIVFYTHKIHMDIKPPKICVDCHKPHYSNVSLCPSCNYKRKNQIRCANAKCKRRRETLQKYITFYNDVISPELTNKIKNMIDKKNTHMDLKELDLLLKETEKELKNNNFL